MPAAVASPLLLRFPIAKETPSPTGLLSSAQLQLRAEAVGTTRSSFTAATALFVHRSMWNAVEVYGSTGGGKDRPQHSPYNARVHSCQLPYDHVACRSQEPVAHRSESVLAMDLSLSWWPRHIRAWFVALKLVSPWCVVRPRMGAVRSGIGGFALKKRSRHYCFPTFAPF